MSLRQLSAVSDLFRQAAIDARLSPVFGATRIHQPVHFTVTAILALTVLSGLIALIGFGYLSQTTTVTGYIETAQANVAVHAPTSGVVESIFVAEFDEVVKDQPIARLTPTRGNHNAMALLAEIDVEADELDRQKQAVRTDFIAQRRALTERIAATRAMLTSLAGQERLLVRQRALSASQAQRAQQLFDKRITTRVDLDQSEQHLLSAELTLARLNETRQRFHTERARHQSALDAIPAQRTAALARLDQTLSTLRQRRINLKSNTQTTIRASIGGRVTALSLRNGQRIAADEPVLVILPHHADYHAELLVQAAHASRFEVGSPVSFTVDIPRQPGRSQRHRYEGRITSVPRAPVLQRRGLRLAEPVFLVRAAFADSIATKHFSPGMTLTARVKHQHRRVLEWLVEPLGELLQRLSF